MHVGLVVYGSLEETSGGFRYDRRLVSHLERRGDDVEIIALPWRSYRRHLLDGVSQSVRKRLDRPFDVLLQDELCHPSLWRHNDRLEQPEAIVSLVHLLRSGHPGGQLRPWQFVETAIERRYLESVDATICTSRDTRDRTVTLADRPTLVAPPGGRVEGAAIDTETVTTRARTADPLRITFLGNVIPRKGVLTLLEALEQVDCEWELTVAGSLTADPAYADSTVAFADDCEMDDRVAFAGEVTDAALESLLERSHILAVPSTYEGFGMVYLEAMEYGVVPVASAVGGAREFVDDERNGFVVDPANPDAIATVIERLGTDRDELAALGENALETAAAHPTWEETMTRVRTFLLEQAEKQRRNRHAGTRVETRAKPESEQIDGDHA
ncbi:glycosyltransferase family 4 protein [Natronorubrum sp. A-ect3]|uniref:glycosyltransferase family 4 protein n=1 Tax=Natronorubrum sp. A-ect3 TaxID=3242698 RepID=UPI00359E05BA